MIRRPILLESRERQYKRRARTRDGAHPGERARI
jgi:hypothetical protein